MCTRKQWASLCRLIQTAHVFAGGCRSRLCAETSWSGSRVVGDRLCPEAAFLGAYVSEVSALLVIFQVLEFLCPL